MKSADKKEQVEQCCETNNYYLMGKERGVKKTKKDKAEKENGNVNEDKTSLAAQGCVIDLGGEFPMGKRFLNAEAQKAEGGEDGG